MRKYPVVTGPLDVALPDIDRKPKTDHYTDESGQETPDVFTCQSLCVQSLRPLQQGCRLMCPLRKFESCGHGKDERDNAD